MMDSDLDRNPSPPPELLESDADLVPDKIGDSVFSKHWLFQTLIRIIEAVNTGNDAVTGSSSVQKLSGDMQNEPDIVELDSTLEEDACTLWDMSANRDVAHFLHEFKVAEIFLEVTEKTRSPRLLEIVVGILGNIVSFDELCKDISANNSLVNAVVRLSGSSDAPTVVQVLRLIQTVIVNKNTTELWTEAINAEPSFMENLKFILENSLNGEVLKRSLQLLYYLLDKGDQLCIEWGKEDQIRAIIEAGRQLSSSKNFEALDEFWMVLNLLCLHEDNVKVLNVRFPCIFRMFYIYLLAIEDYEDILPPVHRVTSVAAAISTMSTFLGFERTNHRFLTEDDAFISFLFKMLRSVGETVQMEESKAKNPLLEEKSLLCGSSVLRAPEECSVPQIDSTKSDSVGNTPFSGGFSSCGRKIPSYKSCITKTAADYNNLLLLRESLEELCVIIRSSVYIIEC